MCEELKSSLSRKLFPWHKQYKLSAGASQLTIFSLQDRTECQNLIRNYVVEYSIWRSAVRIKLIISQTYIFNMWNVLEIHDRSNNYNVNDNAVAVRHVWQQFGTTTSDVYNPDLHQCWLHFILNCILSTIPRYIYVWQCLRLRVCMVALMWARVSKWLFHMQWQWHDWQWHNMSAWVYLP